MAVSDSWSQLPGYKKKKKKKVPGLYQPPGLSQSRPIPQKPVKQAPEPSQPRFPAPIPQRQNIPQPPPSAVYGMNLQNLSQAYFEKYQTFPNAVQTYFMLENSGGELWAKDQWGKMLAPGKALPSPLFNQFDLVARGTTAPSKNIGLLGEDAVNGPPTQEGLYPGRWSGKTQTVAPDSETAWGISEGSKPRFWSGRERDKQIARIPLELQEKDDLVREIGGLSEAERQAYGDTSRNLVAWGQYWAGIQESRGEPVKFDPDSTEWTREKDGQYHRWLYGRNLAYSIYPTDPKVRAKAAEALRLIYQGMLGRQVGDIAEASSLKWIEGHVNMAEVLQTMNDETKKEFIYSGYVDGRLPGQSERKARIDFVSEFGESRLPADEIAAYREDLMTVGRVMGGVFGKIQEVAEAGAEAVVDTLFNKLSSQPGVWGTVGDMCHDSVKMGLLNLNPAGMLTSPAVPKGISEANAWGGALMEIIEGVATVSDDAPGHIEPSMLFHASTWLNAKKAHEGKDMFVDLTNDFADAMGIPIDSSWREGLNDFGTVFSLYAWLKVMTKVDMKVYRPTVRAVYRGTFKAARAADAAAKGAAARATGQAGFIDLGPAKKSESGVDVRDVTLKDGSTITVDSSIADDVARLNDSGFTTHQSHGLKADHPKGHDAAEMLPYMEFKVPDLTPEKALRIQEAAKATGMKITKGKPQNIDGTFTHTVIIKGENLHDFVDALVGKRENLMDAPDRMFGVDEVPVEIPRGETKGALFDRGAAEKKPWQQTKQEFVGDTKSVDEIAIRRSAHALRVKEAVAAGKPVPLEVLESYKLNQWAKAPYEAALKAKVPEEIPGQTGLDVGKVPEPTSVESRIENLRKQELWDKELDDNLATFRRKTYGSLDDIEKAISDIEVKKQLAEIEVGKVARFSARDVKEIGSAAKVDAETISAGEKAVSAAMPGEAIPYARWYHKVDLYDIELELLNRERDRFIFGGKPHEGRLTREQDPVVRELEAEADSIRSVLNREAQAQADREVVREIRGNINTDLPGTTDSDLLAHIKQVAADRGGMARDPFFWDDNLSVAENNKKFLGLARANPSKRVAKGVKPATLEQIAADLKEQGIDVTRDDLWEVMQRENERLAGKTPKAKTGTPKETREAMARLDAIEAEIASLRGAPPRTPEGKRDNTFLEEWADELSDGVVKKAQRGASKDVESAIDEWYQHSGGSGSPLDDLVMLQKVYEAGEPIRAKLHELVGDTIHLYRGIGPSDVEAAWGRGEGQVASSWTHRKNVAESYANHGGTRKGEGRVIEADIPVDDIIFAYPRGGEFTVRGWSDSQRGAPPRTPTPDEFDQHYRYKEDNPTTRGESPEWEAENPRAMTASYREDILMDPEKVQRLPGELGEETKIAGDAELSRVTVLAEKMARSGWQGEAISIRVYADGKAVIMEGNHRVRAATKAGLRDIPVEIRYFGGGERRTSFNPRDYLSDRMSSRFNQPRGAEPSPTPIEAAPSPATAGGPQATTAAPSTSESQSVLPLEEPVSAKPPAEPPTKAVDEPPRPGDPQWIHYKVLMTVVEYIAAYANADADVAISRMLGLPDPLYNAKGDVLRAATADMQKTRDSRVVAEIIKNLDEEGFDSIDPLGPAFFRANKARLYDNAVSTSESAGPLAGPIIRALRIFGTPIHFNMEIPGPEAYNTMRSIAYSVKFGRKKMTTSDVTEVNRWTRRAYNAATEADRRAVVNDFMTTILSNFKEDGRLEAYRDFEKSIIRKKVSWVHGKGMVKSGIRSYGGEGAVVTPGFDVFHAQAKDYRESAKRSADNGDVKMAAVYKKLAEDTEKNIAELDKATKTFKEADADPSSHYALSKDGKQQVDSRTGEIAMDKDYQDALDTFRKLGREQPVWSHQYSDALTLGEDPRVMAWFQSGRSWQAFMKYDTLVADHLMRQWKQWTLAGLGFPIRVYAGDEFWRLPMEGISPFGPGAAEVRNMVGELSPERTGLITHLLPSEQKTLRLLEEKRDARESGLFSPKEQNKYDELMEKKRVKVPDELVSLIRGEDFRGNADFARLWEDSWDLLGPTPLAGGGFTRPSDLRYYKFLPIWMKRMSDDPVIKVLLKREDWTPEEARVVLRNFLTGPTEEAAALRSRLVESNRITSRMADPAILTEIFMHPSSGAYRHLQNLVGEWADSYLLMVKSPIMKEGLQGGYISKKQLERIPAEDLPTIPVGGLDMDVAGGWMKWLNVGPRVYEGMTLPMLAAISKNIRYKLFYHEYMAQRKALLTKNPDRANTPEGEATLMQESSERAAHFVQRSTYTRDATVFEDMVRNHILFINSYRQFMVYWLEKVVTRPFTMATLWSEAPEASDEGISGDIANYFGYLMPFFLNPRITGETREKTMASMVGSIAQVPGAAPHVAPLLEYAVREGLHEDPTNWPLTGGGFAPLSRIGQITEGVFNWTPPFSKDDAYTHAAMEAMEKEGVDAGDYDTPGTGVGSQELKSDKVFPMNVLDWVNKHTGDKLFGNPVATEQLIANFVGLPSFFVQKPPVWTEYITEQAKWYELMGNGDLVGAAKYLQTTKRLGLMQLIKSTKSEQEKSRLLDENPWAFTLLNTDYSWDSNGSLVFDENWVRSEITRGQGLKDLRERYREQYGGTALDENGIAIEDESAVYGGDIARRDMAPIVKQHTKDILDLARTAAREEATLHGVVNKKWYQQLMSDWKSRTDSYAMLGLWKTGPDAPDWYTDYVTEHKAELSRDLPEGYTVHAYWHPKFYADRVLSLYKSDYRGGNWEPSDTQAKIIAQLRDAGIFSPLTLQMWDTGIDGKVTAVGNAVKKAKDDQIDKWRTNIINIETDEFWTLDSSRLNQIGYNMTPAIDVAIKKVRAKYFEWQSIVGQPNPDGPGKITSGSTEYREARNKFNAFKDATFSKVKGGEAFVGGTPERLMHTPFLTGGKSLPFTGEDAVDDTKLWKRYTAEASKARPDLKKLRLYSDHFDGHFKDKIAAYNAANHWVAVTGTALTMRWIMKTSYSEYYQGPGNSVYSNYGKAMVAKLEKLIQSYTEDCPTFGRDLTRYGFDDAHDLSYSLLEWYDR